MKEHVDARLDAGDDADDLARPGEPGERRQQTGRGVADVLHALGDLADALDLLVEAGTEDPQLAGQLAEIRHQRWHVALELLLDDRQDALGASPQSTEGPDGPDERHGEGHKAERHDRSEPEPHEGEIMAYNRVDLARLTE